MLGLANIGGAGQEGEGLAVCAHVEALKENVAERIVPGEVVHRLLAEHEQPIEAAPCKLFGRGPATVCQLRGREVDQLIEDRS